jgi:hypothetical protein
MHWSRVISEDDNPEWISVLHADGSLSEVKVAVFNDSIHIRVDSESQVFIDSGDGS